MRLSERMVRRKSFVQPPFWSQNNLSLASSLPLDREAIENDFAGYIDGAYKSNGVVFACELARMALFSEARFLWREYRNGRPGNLFGTPELALLENPWPGGTTGELLVRMIQDADLAGNFYGVVVDDDGNVGRSARGPGRRVARLRPDWVTIILGSRSGHLHALDTKVVAYEYAPPPLAGDSVDPVVLTPSEVAHFSPLPDPAARFRGMSWLTPVVSEIRADKAATKHKLKFFDNGATLSTVVSLDKDIDPDAFAEWVAKFRAQHEGVDTAYKTLFLGGGAQASVVGANMQQVDFKATQGAGETRVAAAAGVHPVVVGLSEGMQGSSLNAGNFNSAVRLTADKTMRPLWRMAAASLQRLLTPPRSEGVGLWYDDRDIAFLRDDTTDVAEIQSKQAVTIRQYVDAGYDPASVVDAVQTGDLTRLVHTGLYSVQLQRPGTTAEEA